MEVQTPVNREVLFLATNPPLSAARLTDFLTYFLSLPELSATQDSPIKTLSDTDIAPLISQYPVHTQTSFLELIQHITSGSINTRHPLFANQLFGQSDLLAAFAVFITSVMNCTLATHEMSPVFSKIERQVIQEVLTKVGLHNGEGLFVPGGSNANFLALVLALFHKIPHYKSKGLNGGTHYKLLVSDQAHYSYKKAAMACGLGEQSVIVVPSLPTGQIDPEQLLETAHKCHMRGEKIVFLGLTAGTTVTASYDDFETCVQIMAPFDTWIHVDGAYGGLAFYSEHHHGLMKGLADVDSFSHDYHKSGGVPLLNTMLVTRHRCLVEAFYAGGSYLFHGSDEVDLGIGSFECGKPPRGFIVWLMQQYYGKSYFGQRFDQLMANAALAESRIMAHPQLELVVPRQSINVCFRHKTIDTVELRETLLRQNKAHVNYSDLQCGNTHYGTIVRLPICSVEFDTNAFFDLL